MGHSARGAEVVPADAILDGPLGVPAKLRRHTTGLPTARRRQPRGDNDPGFPPMRVSV